MIYLDYAATTPMLDVSIEAYGIAAKEVYGNTSIGMASFLQEAERKAIFWRFYHWPVQDKESMSSLQARNIRASMRQ